MTNKEIRARYEELVHKIRTAEEDQEFLKICEVLMDEIFADNVEVFKRLKER